MKRIIKSLWVALATLSALLSVVSCVKDLAVKEQEVNFDSSLTTEQSQIVKGDSTATTQLLINEDKIDCPRPTKYSVSFTYDETVGTLLFFGKEVKSDQSIPLASLANLSLTYQAKKLEANKVKVTVTNDVPKPISHEATWTIAVDKPASNEVNNDNTRDNGGDNGSKGNDPHPDPAPAPDPAPSPTPPSAVTPETYAVSIGVVNRSGQSFLPWTDVVRVEGADDLTAVPAGTKLTLSLQSVTDYTFTRYEVNEGTIQLSLSSHSNSFEVVVEQDLDIKFFFSRTNFVIDVDPDDDVTPPDYN